MKESAGSFGIITPVSGHFCDGCNRIRVTSTGLAKSCLFSTTETDLKSFVSAFDTLGLHEALRRIVTDKPGKHRISVRQADHAPFSMVRVGG
jgi:cyclic pyranopterin phosphate synthase